MREKKRHVMLLRTSQSQLVLRSSCAVNDVAIQVPTAPIYMSWGYVYLGRWSMDDAGCNIVLMTGGTKNNETRKYIPREAMRGKVGNQEVVHSLCISEFI